MSPTVNEGDQGLDSSKGKTGDKVGKQQARKRKRETHKDENVHASSEVIESDGQAFGELIEPDGNCSSESLHSESVRDESEHQDMSVSESNDNNKKKKKATPFCWLCEYQGNRTTNEVLKFIMDNIPHMTLDSLISQSKYILDRVDIGSDCSCIQIRMHITTHMLHPRIKLALQLQEMIKMQKEVAKCCVVDDMETGGKTINPQAMKVYLTMCSQVAAVYKIGEDKLTFNQGQVDK